MKTIHVHYVYSTGLSHDQNKEAGVTEMQRAINL